MSRPDSRRRHAIAVGASYSDAPGEVIEALVESALAVPDVLREPAPRAVVTAFQDFGIAYTLQFWTDTYYTRTQLEGDVSRMIWYQFKRRGIEIPFPMSDQLLNDFMAVVYRQRTLPPGDEETARRAVELAHSDFANLLRDTDNRPLVQDEGWRRIAEAVKRVRFTRGEIIFRQGDAGGSCYTIVKGRLRARMKPADSDQVRDLDLAPGAVFGEMSLLTGLPRTATIEALGECELLEITPDAFTRLLALHPDIPKKLADLVARRSSENTQACHDLLAMPGGQAADSLRPQSLLSRFLRLLGRPAGPA
jgi:CRP-like cAMP-binding protein